MIRSYLMTASVIGSFVGIFAVGLVDRMKSDEQNGLIGLYMDYANYMGGGYFMWVFFLIISTVTDLFERFGPYGQIGLFLAVILVLGPFSVVLVPLGVGYYIFSYQSWFARYEASQVEADIARMQQEFLGLQKQKEKIYESFQAEAALASTRQQKKQERRLFHDPEDDYIDDDDDDGKTKQSKLRMDRLKSHMKEKLRFLRGYKGTEYFEALMEDFMEEFEERMEGTLVTINTPFDDVADRVTALVDSAGNKDHETMHNVHLFVNGEILDRIRKALKPRWWHRRGRDPKIGIGYVYISKRNRLKRGEKRIALSDIVRALRNIRWLYGREDGNLEGLPVDFVHLYVFGVLAREHRELQTRINNNEGALRGKIYMSRD